MRVCHRFVLLLGVLLLLAISAAVAQDDDVTTYVSTWALFPQIILTIMWSSAYLAIYAAALIITLAYLQRFGAVDGDLLIWTGVLWLGGLVINALAYALAGDLLPQHPAVGRQLLAAGLAIPMLFGWTVFISTRQWGDLTVRDAMRVALVVALVCAPYFGSTWRIQPPPPPEMGHAPHVWDVTDTPQHRPHQRITHVHSCV